MSLDNSPSSFAFKVSLPSLQVGLEADLVNEIKEKLSQDASCRTSDIQLTVDSFADSELHGRVMFQSKLCCERALVSLQQNGIVIHYTEDDAIDCTIEIEEQDHNEDPYFFRESTIKVQPLLSHIDPISLFNTFRSYGPIPRVKIDLEAAPTGNLVRVGTLAFSHPSSSSAAVNSIRANPRVFDPCTLKIASDASELRSRPWKEYEDEQELEDKIRDNFPEAVEVRIVGFSSTEDEVVGLARFSRLEDVKVEWLGRKVLEGLGAVVVQLVSLTEEGISLQATPLFSAPPSLDPRLAKPLPRFAQPSVSPAPPIPQPSRLPTTPSNAPPNPVASGSSQASVNPPLPPTRQPHASTSFEASSSSSTLASQPWKSTLKPYPFSQAVLRPKRPEEPPINEAYAVSDLPQGDAERRRDVILAYHGQEWPDFSTMESSKMGDISSLASRQARHRAEHAALIKRGVQIKSEELRVLETTWATSDLPKPGQELTDSDRRAMEASLVDLELGLQRQQRHDDAQIHFIRTREDPESSLFAAPPHSSQHLLAFADLGISKRTKASDPRNR